MWFDFITLYFEVGGFVMPPLVLATVLLWFALGYRFSVLKRGDVRSVRVLVEKARNGEALPKKGVIVSAIARGLEIKQQNKPYLRRYLDDAFSGYEVEVKKFSTVVTSIVAVAPVLGLLGTVAGMIETFDSLTDMALFAQGGGIAGGISQALFTTQMGLAVAIPGLVMDRMLKRKQQRIERELNQVKDLLCADQEVFV